MAQILIVEDEVKIARFLELELKYEGYTVHIASNGREGLEKGLNPDIDLIILDLMLPILSGIEVCRRIRQTSDVPIIMLTAKDDVSDKVMGLDMGADDYITKPFAIEELLARMRVALKRKKTDTINDSILSFNNLTLNKQQRQVKVNKEEIILTKKEFELLAYLLENKNIVLSRENILERVWGFEYYGDTNIIDVYIRYLRGKIDQKYSMDMIHTVRGVGYLIKDVV
ncbi:MAG: response regulator transcription factor [Vallitalea sp.]|jgi:DNA-binding response OmpR family regulator|nr:response regulator transcription factor [Vallitalea sp.]